MTLTSDVQAKERALRRMKVIATGAFLLMVVVFLLTKPLGNSTVFWVVRWDHINAFAEASMVGALADWFAVVALFRHPLGIPIWHTAIIPRKKDDIARNLAGFVENRLLSVENLTREISRFSPSSLAADYLNDPENQRRITRLLSEVLGVAVRQLDDQDARELIRRIAAERLNKLDAASLLGGGLQLLADSGKHHQLLDQGLDYLAEWMPTHRPLIHDFIERALERMLKWGRKLVPGAVVDRATDQVLTALIEVLQEAARDPGHPLRAGFDRKIEEWIEKLKEDPDWRARIDEWKHDLLERPGLRNYIENIWTGAREWLLNDIEQEDSVVQGHLLRAIEAFHHRLQDDADLRSVIDDRLRSAVVTVLGNHHHAIGSLIRRVVDSWDARQLSRELELNLGRDLQYIRLNGTFIGGLVGLLIHLIRF